MPWLETEVAANPRRDAVHGEGARCRRSDRWSGSAKAERFADCFNDPVLLVAGEGGIKGEREALLAHGSREREIRGAPIEALRVIGEPMDRPVVDADANAPSAEVCEEAVTVHRGVQAY